MDTVLSPTTSNNGEQQDVLLREGTVSWLLHRFYKRTPDPLNLYGFRKKRTHSSEQCALSCVNRVVIVSNGVLISTIDSKCVEEKSDFLSIEKHVMFQIAESAEIANCART